MQKMTIRIDDDTKNKLNEFCSDHGLNPSQAIRKIIEDSLSNHSLKSELGFREPIGEYGIMMCEKRAMLASIETVELVKRIAKMVSGKEEPFKDKSLSEIHDDSIEKIKEGFIYSNNRLKKHKE